MKKSYMWYLWILSLVAVNLLAIPWAMWSTFAGTEEYKYVWYAIAILILILFNTGIIQTFLAIKSNRLTYIWWGFSLIVVQVACLLLSLSMYQFVLYLLLGPVVLSLILLIVQLVKKA